MLTIDDLHYRVALCKAESEVEQLTNFIGKIEIEENIDNCRVKTLIRNKDIAYNQFKQVKKLFEEYNVGTKFDVDTFEKAYNSACDSLDVMEKNISLYPIQVNEAKSKLKSVKANLTLARSNLSK